MTPTQDLHVKEIVRLSPPRADQGRIAHDGGCNATVVRGRQAIKRILEQKDPRLLVVVGPCSIHDTRGALEYAGTPEPVAPGIPGRRWKLSCAFISKSRARPSAGKG